MQQLIAGNWKMNGLRADLDILDAIERDMPGKVEGLVCVPSTLLVAATADRGSLAIGAQDCHAEEAGAHTGDLSAPMLADAGASDVIVGHSERRTEHGETNEIIAAKARAAHAAGLRTIVCIGETEGERDAGRTLDVLAEQLRGSIPDCATATNTVVAYEPVWAIGTGRSAAPADVEEAHEHVRSILREMIDGGERVRVLYGGSVKPDNAEQLLAIGAVGGALVGGASLKASDFLAICNAARD